MAELAELADELRDERWRDEEASAGRARVVEGLDAAVIAVDDGGVVRLANRTAERLVGRSPRSPRPCRARALHAIVRAPRAPATAAARSRRRTAAR
jgi:nitrogen fixation/metabolism regulation signal transduction histidine kinase